ncbi:MAG: HD domain-containing protein [Acidaminococcaceae bacterium]|nr:HD domain-containing protein [Acidaminococcaceae bacterium]
MIQKTYHLANYTEEKARRVLAQVEAMPAYRNAAQVLLLILEQNWDEECIRAKTALVKSALDKAEIVGVTHFDGMGPEGDLNSSIFTFLFFEQDAFTVCRFPMEGKTDVEAGNEVQGVLRDIPDIRCVMALFSKNRRDTGLLLETAQRGLPGFPMFGSDAGVEGVFGGADSAGKAYVFDGDGCYRDTLLAVVFRGPSLHVMASYNFGWIPVGKPFTITKLKDPYTVAEIDHLPAAAIYEKYLGIPYRTNKLTIRNICEFPLTVKRNGVLMARIPYAWNEEGDLQFQVAMREGERVRLSYGLPRQIFSQICHNADEFREFKPQAMLMVICMNRMVFLRDDEHLETDVYRAIVPDAAFLHGNSEVFRNGGAGGEMHSALIAVGFREGEARDIVSAPEPACPFSEGDHLIPLENRLMTFIRAVTGDLESLTGELLHLQRNLEREVEKKTRENEGLSLHVVQTLAEAIDAKDTYTNGHSARVAAYSREIAKRAGYSEKEQNIIYVMGILHDVGKIGVPDAVINKPGKLTDEEFAEIRKHPAKGAKILENIKEMPNLSTGAHWHHERYDGKGYPDRLLGEAIPAEARIIGVADAYDAMTSNRSYRRSMPQSAVREQIEKGKGTQFDPVFADIMLQMIDEDKDYRMREI